MNILTITYAEGGTEDHTVAPGSFLEVDVEPGRAVYRIKVEPWQSFRADATAGVDVDQALAGLGRIGLTAALEDLLELKFAAWAAIPDVAGNTRGEDISVARFIAICDACRILGINNRTRPPDRVGMGSPNPVATVSTVRDEEPHTATPGPAPDVDTPAPGQGRHRRRVTRRLPGRRKPAG